MGKSSKKEQLKKMVSGIFEASIQLNRIAEELLNKKGYSLNCSALGVLISIERAESLMTVPQIAERYCISRQAVQRQVQSLVKEGLIERCVNPNHKRSSCYRLTKEGKKTIEVIFTNVFDPWLNNVAERYDHVDLSETLTVLNKIVNT